MGWKSGWHRALISHPTSVLIPLTLLLLLDMPEFSFSIFLLRLIQYSLAKRQCDFTMYSQGTQNFWKCAKYWNPHLADNYILIFFSAFLCLPKWGRQLFCPQLLIIHHPLKILGFAIYKFSPAASQGSTDAADKWILVANHAAKLCHTKENCHFSTGTW